METQCLRAFGQGALKSEVQHRGEAIALLLTRRHFRNTHSHRPNKPSHFGNSTTMCLHIDLKFLKHSMTARAAASAVSPPQSPCCSNTARRLPNTPRRSTNKTCVQGHTASMFVQPDPPFDSH